MKYEFIIITRTILRLGLILLALILPVYFVENHVLLHQVWSIILVVTFFSVIQYHTIIKVVKKSLSKFGGNFKSKSIEHMIEDLEGVFESSRHTSLRYERMNRALSLSIEINNLFLQRNDQQSVYDFILTKALEALGKTDKGSILLLENDDLMRCISLQGFDESFHDLRIKKEDDFLYKTTNGQVDRSVIIDDIVEFNRSVMTEEAFEAFYKKYPKIFQTVLSTPIRVDGEFIGVINIDAHEPDVFNEEDIFIMDLFASQLEVAIRNRNLLDEILFLSRYDGLTGVYNRKHFDDIVETMIKNEKPFTYALIDINNLKTVNDVHGHVQGDQLLKNFCEIAKGNIREYDYIARLGGDEFALLLTTTNKLEASKAFLRMMRKLNDFVVDHDLSYKIEFSYGLAEYPLDASSMDELYMKSDNQMYKMKRNLKENKS